MVGTVRAREGQNSRTLVATSKRGEGAEFSWYAETGTDDARVGG